MRFNLLCKWPTRVGVFYIGQAPDGLFHYIFDDEGHGPFISAAQAADELANGAGDSIEGIRDTSQLGIPADVSEWEVVE